MHGESRRIDDAGSEAPASGTSLAAFFELAIDHLCVAGFDGYWKQLNPAWTSTLGYSVDELMARPLIDFVHPDDRAATLSARGRLKEGEPLRTLTNRYRCRDGSYRWFEWRSAADPNAELVYAVARDVTTEKEAQLALHEAQAAQRALEQQLLLADRLASVGTLAAGVAHEINNPLSYIALNLHMLSEEALRRHPSALGPEWLTMIAEAQQGCERIGKIVRDMMTFSRAERERRQLVDLKHVLDLAINMARNEIRHRARLSTDLGDVPLVDADESRLVQVFINLLVNAAQAIPEGRADQNEIRVVTSTARDGSAVVEVHDTGPGIPDDVLGRMFDPFFTTKPVGVGTGLGLSICHTIVQGLGGTIAAENRAPHGALLRVTLRAGSAASQPLRRAPEAPTAPRPVTEPRPVSVLVIDDEPQVAFALERMLRAHTVTALSSAKRALELLLGGATFDVILSDLMMPEMSGGELYLQLQRHRPMMAQRVVFMTGGAFTAEAHEFLKGVSNERIQKPFDVEAVRALVQRYAR